MPVCLAPVTSRAVFSALLYQSFISSEISRKSMLQPLLHFSNLKQALFLHFSNLPADLRSWKQKRPCVAHDLQHRGECRLFRRELITSSTILCSFGGRSLECLIIRFKSVFVVDCATESGACFPVTKYSTETPRACAIFTAFSAVSVHGKSLMHL